MTSTLEPSHLVSAAVDQPARGPGRRKRSGASPAIATQSRRNSQGPRGFRGRGGGAWPLMPLPVQYRASSFQVCGFWPFAGGSSRPTIGVPVGQDIETGSTVCCDAFSWFKAGLTSSPSMMIFGLNGMGKSSFTTRQIIGCIDQGVQVIVAGDLKGEYVDLGRAMGGQIKGGVGDQTNLLDLGAMSQAADRIGGIRGDALRELAVQRAVDAVAANVQIIRKSHVEDWEASVLGYAIRLLIERHRGEQPPTLPELAHLLRNPTQEMISQVLLADNQEEYWALTKRLNRSVQALLKGPLGGVFGGQTTERLRTDAPMVVIDISTLARQSADVLAAVMLASWSEAFASIEAANALTDAGLEPQRHYLTVMDEMWRAMRLEGAGLVDKLDSITRLQRNDGVGNIYITHSMKDLTSMASEADNMKARGFAERSGIIVTAGLAKPDLLALSEIRRMSQVEIGAVASWSTPPGWRQRMIIDPRTGVSRPAPPPGAGKVLIKIGDRAGIQTQVKLTPAEIALHDTNERWVTESMLAGPESASVPAQAAPRG